MDPAVSCEALGFSPGPFCDVIDVQLDEEPSVWCVLGVNE